MGDIPKSSKFSSIMKFIHPSIAFVSAVQTCCLSLCGEFVRLSFAEHDGYGVGTSCIAILLLLLRMFHVPFFFFLPLPDSCCVSLFPNSRRTTMEGENSSPLAAMAGENLRLSLFPKWSFGSIRWIVYLRWWVVISNLPVLLVVILCRGWSIFFFRSKIFWRSYSIFLGVTLGDSGCVLHSAQPCRLCELKLSLIELLCGLKFFVLISVWCAEATILELPCLPFSPAEVSQISFWMNMPFL